MTLINAALRAPTCSLSRVLAHKPHGKAANDNDSKGTVDQELLAASLRFFAQHGLSAAAEARTQAEECFHAGDAAGYDHWLAICHMLDRRMAEKLAKKFAAEDASATA